MIQIENLAKHFQKLTVFEDLTLSIEKYSLVSLVGPSGCGKTTFLNLVAGLDKQDFGRISFEDNTNPHTGYMMQDPLLLPWRTLLENARLGAEITRHSPKSLPANEFFRAFDLDKQKHIYPEAASAGMKQRVALIRTLALNPSLLLLDEPFSNLDFDIKLKIQRFLVRYAIDEKVTILFVTHDIEDAIALADRVIVLSEKPARIKADVSIDLQISKKDPVQARKSPKFREYFIQIWDELKYLDNND